jgi:hypothetical protein
MSALVPRGDPLQKTILPAGTDPLDVSTGSGDPLLPPLSVALVEW